MDFMNKSQQVMFCGENCAPFLVIFLGVLQASEECNTEIDLRGVLSDVIRSPNFPNSYPAGVECTWSVVAPLRYRIKVKFNAFKLGECGSKTCDDTSFDCDMLEVYDGAGNTSSLIGRFCANHGPPGFYSKENALRIRFKSSSRPNNGSFGFEAMLSTENMVLALLLPILGCILLLSIIIAVPVIIKCRRQRILARKSLSSSDRLCRSDTDLLPMSNSTDMEERLSSSDQGHSIPLLFRETEGRL